MKSRGQAGLFIVYPALAFPCTHCTLLFPFYFIENVSNFLFKSFNNSFGSDSRINVVSHDENLLKKSSFALISTRWRGLSAEEKISVTAKQIQLIPDVCFFRLWTLNCMGTVKDRLGWTIRHWYFRPPGGLEADFIGHFSIWTRCEKSLMVRRSGRVIVFFPLTSGR